MKTKTKLEPKGIGGWLLLPLSGLIFSLVWSLSDSIPRLKQALAACRGGCDAKTLVPVGLMLLFDLILVAFVGWLLSLSYRRSKRFPKWMQFLLLASAALGVFGGLVEYLAIRHGRTGPSSPEVWMYPLAYALIWIPYFKWSQRVKNTLTQP